MFCGNTSFETLSVQNFFLVIPARDYKNNITYSPGNVFESRGGINREAAVKSGERERPREKTLLPYMLIPSQPSSDILFFNQFSESTEKNRTRKR